MAEVVYRWVGNSYGELGEVLLRLALEVVGSDAEGWKIQLRVADTGGKTRTMADKLFPVICRRLSSMGEGGVVVFPKGTSRYDVIEWAVGMKRFLCELRSEQFLVQTPNSLSVIKERDVNGVLKRLISGLADGEEIVFTVRRIDDFAKEMWE